LIQRNYKALQRLGDLVTVGRASIVLPCGRNFMEKKMRFANVGTIDRLLRLLIGAGLIAAPFFTGVAAPQSGAGYAMIAVGAILVLTALVSFCPLYSVFGLRTKS